MASLFFVSLFAVVLCFCYNTSPSTEMFSGSQGPKQKFLFCERQHVFPELWVFNTTNIQGQVVQSPIKLILD